MSHDEDGQSNESLDVSDFDVETLLCPDCQMHYVRVTGFVHEGPSTLTAYYAVCHGHPHHQVAVDLIFGTWGTGDAQDHETFSCLVRPEGVMAVDPFVTVTFGPNAVPAIFGRPVTRAEALLHPRLPLLWRVVDALVEEVDPIAEQYQSR